MDTGASLDSVRGEEIERIVAPADVEAEVQLVASSSITRMDEYDSTLYFLDEAEVDYLQTEVRRDFGTDLRAQVIASLLDTYEQQTDPAIRDEIATILDGLFLLLLSLMQFRTAAYLIRAAAVTVGRATDLKLGQRQRLMQLADRLSEKDALEQLLQALEETPLRQPQGDLQELLGQLKPSALETVLSWIAHGRNAELRALLGAAGLKLAAAHIAELVRLISSPDEIVSYEAVRRAGALKSSAAVSALAGTISHPAPEMRLAGVSALSDPLVVLDTFELAVVYAANPRSDALSRPIVKIVSDAQGNMLHPAPEADLAQPDSFGDYPRTIIKTADPGRYGVNVGDYFV